MVKEPHCTEPSFGFGIERVNQSKKTSISTFTVLPMLPCIVCSDIVILLPYVAVCIKCHQSYIKDVSYT